MDNHNITAKKSLGQNFLQDKKALQRIVEAAELSASDNVLEIGPGTGVLTEELMKRAGRVVAVEKDERLVWYLNSKFEIRNSKCMIIEGDILKINLPSIIEQKEFQPYKVVANIPYYITGQIIRLLLETKYPPTMMVLLVQKEVAERICAKPGDMSILAVSVQYYGRPEIMGIVPKESFSPVPDVDSAILKVVINKPFDVQDKRFFQLVRIGFSSRRKTLVNNLAAGYKKDKKDIEALLQQAGLASNVRAQELSVEDWKRILPLLGS